MRASFALALPLTVLAACDSHVQRARDASACYPLACETGLSTAKTGEARIASLSRKAQTMAQNLGGTPVGVAGRTMDMAQVTLEGQTFMVFTNGAPSEPHLGDADLSEQVLTTASQLSPCGRATRAWRSRGIGGTAPDYVVHLGC